jgi:hypothetical protein
MYSRCKRGPFLRFAIGSMASGSPVLEDCLTCILEVPGEDEVSCQWERG